MALFQQIKIISAVYYYFFFFRLKTSSTFFERPELDQRRWWTNTGRIDGADLDLVTGVRLEMIERHQIPASFDRLVDAETGTDLS